MTLFFEGLVALLIFVSAAFLLVGSWGMIRMPELMTRLHAPTKATTLGVGGALLASIIYFSVFETAFTVHELLVSIFLFLTAPITAMFLGKAYMHCNLDPGRDVPRAGERGWSTYEAAPTMAPTDPADKGGQR